MKYRLKDCLENVIDNRGRNPKYFENRGSNISSVIPSTNNTFWIGNFKAFSCLNLTKSTCFSNIIFVVSYNLISLNQYLY